MKPEELFRIWDRFERSDISELVFETADGKLCLKRRNAGAEEAGPSAEPAKEFRLSSLAQKKSAEEMTDNGKKAHPVKAPLVGTFYRASAPGERPFVRIGQSVKEGETVGIIEAMKLMNEITAPCAGIIENILVEDETLVEYGQPLMSIGEENV